MTKSTALPASIIKVNNKGTYHHSDLVATEEPLEIRIGFNLDGERKQKSISVTMRTPGSDYELATGFLFTEGIIGHKDDIISIKHCNGLNENVVRVELKDDVQVEIGKLERNFYTTSSCGVCGKSSIEAVKTVCRLHAPKNNNLRFSSLLLHELPPLLRSNQNIFDFTGGLHGCGIFNDSGHLLLSREDIGRHNALDKLIGAALHQPSINLASCLLLLSGRVSFELIQKAYMAQIKMVAAVGAPSSLAVQMAEEFGITLIGFLRNSSFNIYSGEERIIIEQHENSHQG
jgi:FdhD protein